MYGWELATLGPGALDLAPSAPRMPSVQRIRRLSRGDRQPLLDLADVQDPVRAADIASAESTLVDVGCPPICRVARRARPLLPRNSWDARPSVGVPGPVSASVDALAGWRPRPRSRGMVSRRQARRPNTAYRITLLPGLVDLRGNVRKEMRTILFSTGPTFPAYSITGRVFDWAAERPAFNAYIEAISRADTTIVYLAASDTSGQFDAGPLPQGEYLVRALIDQNANRTLDRNEKWDTVSVNVINVRPVVELDAIQRDSMPPLFQNITSIDSVTVRITFDKPIDPFLALQPALIRLQKPDSSQLEVASVVWQAAYDQAKARAQQVADSLRRAADTTARAARPAAPPIPTPTPGAAGRAPPPPPKPRLPPPDRGIVVTVSPTTPLVPGTYVATARGIRNLLGRAKDMTRTFTVSKPTVADSLQRARADSARRPPAVPPRRPPP